MKEQVHGGDVYRHKGVLDYSSNMNPFGTPESVVRAAKESMEEIANYPDIRCEALRKKLSEAEEVDPSMLIFGNGAAEVIFQLVQGVRPRRALLPAPTFSEYAQALKTVGCQIEYYELKEENLFYPGEDFFDAIHDGLDLLILCNPNNPTGTLLPLSFMEKVLLTCKKHKVFLMVDECFQDFVEPCTACSMKPYVRDYPNLFLLKAFTKRYAMAGIRLGYGISGNRKLLERMEQMVQPWNVSIPAQAAGLAALEERDYAEKACRLVQKERAFLVNELQKYGMQTYDSRANYIFFRGPEGLVERFLEHQILIRDCSNYPGLSKGYYRIAVKNPDENVRLIRALQAIMEKGE